jgi:lipooligosaccharide transport system permease protein
MFTAAFECSFGTYIRLEFDKVYDGMLAAPITANDLLLGEILWAGTKGIFFSLVVIFVEALFGIVPMPLSILSGIVGFFTGIMFATISLFVTSLVSNINQFNFFFTGFLSPQFFFAGVVFPLANLPPALRPVAEIFPLTHAVRMARSLDLGRLDGTLALDFLCILGFTVVAGFFAIRRLKRKLIQ